MVAKEPKNEQRVCQAVMRLVADRRDAASALAVRSRLMLSFVIGLRSNGCLSRQLPSSRWSTRVSRPFQIRSLKQSCSPNCSGPLRQSLPASYPGRSF